MSGFSAILYYCETLPQKASQEFLLLWETSGTQANLIISRNKSNCFNFYDPLHF